MHKESMVSTDLRDLQDQEAWRKAQVFMALSFPVSVNKYSGLNLLNTCNLHLPQNTNCTPTPPHYTHSDTVMFPAALNLTTFLPLPQYMQYFTVG